MVSMKVFLETVFDSQSIGMKALDTSPDVVS